MALRLALILWLALILILRPGSLNGRDGAGLVARWSCALLRRRGFRCIAFVLPFTATAAAAFGLPHAVGDVGSCELSVIILLCRWR